MLLRVERIVRQFEPHAPSGEVVAVCFVAGSKHAQPSDAELTLHLAPEGAREFVLGWIYKLTLQPPPGEGDALGEE